jgi:branched-subunit amino acid aminotransferase/4-amino-4-deoxychorismate lyase
MSGNLSAVEAKIARVLAIKPECFVTHPAELKILNSINREELNDFAARRGWHVVCRVGGRQIEFYNDASMRANL